MKSIYELSCLAPLFDMSVNCPLQACPLVLDRRIIQICHSRSAHYTKELLLYIPFLKFFPNCINYTLTASNKFIVTTEPSTNLQNTGINY